MLLSKSFPKIKMEELRLNNCNTILNLLLLINIRAKVKNIRKIRVEPDLVTFFWKKLVGRGQRCAGPDFSYIPYNVRFYTVDLIENHVFTIFNKSECLLSFNLFGLTNNNIIWLNILE